MEIQVHKLREAVEIIGPAIPRNPTMKSLTCFMVQDGRAVANDLEVAIIMQLPGAEGKYLFPYQEVADLLKRIRGNDMLTVEQEGNKLKMAWSEGKANFETHYPEAYPDIPEVEAMVEHMVDGGILVPALLAMADYCATEDKRPVLNGVFLEIGEATNVVAADGYRLSWKSLPLPFPDGTPSIIIPARAVRLLGRLLDKAPKTPPATDDLVKLITAKRELVLRFTPTRLHVRYGLVSLVTNLIEGSFPDYMQLIPKEIEARIGVMATELDTAVRQVSMVAKNGGNMVRLAWADSTMTVASKNSEGGEVEATIPVYIPADTPGRVAINGKYLLKYLQGKDGLVTLETCGESAPFLCRYGKTPPAILMPMHANWETGGVAEETEPAGKEDIVGEEPGGEEEVEEGAEVGGEEEAGAG